jgi:fermentation-respiration switch protein FrsA (DUF1100 family)
MQFHKICKKIAIVVGGYLIFCLVAGFGIAEFALHPARRAFTPASQSEGDAHASDDDAKLSEVSITAKDGIPLYAWTLRPREWNGNSVIVLHGLKDNRLGMMDYADIFLAHGYSVLIPDARAHGESRGTVVSYGFLETDDIRRWLDWMAANEHPGCMYGFGESMGAAQLLQTLPVAPQFCAVAVECPFSTYRETAYDRMGQPFHLGPWVGRTILWPAVESAFLYARVRYGLDMEKVSPEDAVAASKVPVLLIHGTTDTNIPLRHSIRIVERRKDVVLWQVPNTGHSNAIDTSPEELQSRMISWFEQHEHVQ